MNDEKSLRDFQPTSWLLVSIQDQLLRPEVLHQEVLISSPWKKVPRTEDLWN